MPVDRSRTTKVIGRARSFLFVPGDRPERFAKALSTAADVVVIDLEDAVAPARKAGAREALKALDAGDGLDRIVVRINASTTCDFEEDVEACKGVGVGAVMLAKTEGNDSLDRVVSRSGDIRIIALVESALGIERCAEIASHVAVDRIAFGSIDYQLDLGIPEDGPGLAAARSEIVLRSRLASIAAPIEGVTAAYSDGTQLMTDISVARSFGFSGKLAIHPLQIEAINHGFAPSEAEVTWAKRILAAAEEAGGEVGAVSLNGEMIDRPVLLRAERILERMEEVR
ncbi:CoA ester lyase [Rhizobium sp. CCGE 510]|uniref:HpcH/HpaI aldolase/citrate lyase family protein n=1 Tax=Rhizobium sp. CCGE 510 TaxID=1132836 RepID=UPI00027B816B|nr:CoA ester lyase [Rhizobium sp. CCGE 510]EJT04452.1 citrate lyase [Rhizobium sp. CCGE 510]